MKRIIGSMAAIVLALSFGISAYAKATPKQKSVNSTTASQPSVSKNSRHHKRRKHHRMTRHHKMRGSMHGSEKPKTQTPANVKKGKAPQQ
jgi:hypothetical protein